MQQTQTPGFGDATPRELAFFSGDPLSIWSLMLALAVGLAFALAIRWHFRRFGATLSNREEFAQVFPFILLTTILIISVVKSSLALSLGLVGALSIVRFRTPIKEPEELAYLFLCIAIGLGLGANQILPTAAAGAAILAVMAALKRDPGSRRSKNLYVTIEARGTTAGADRLLERLNDALATHARAIDLRRFDARDGVVEVTYFIDVENAATVARMTEDLRAGFPGLGVTFLDQSQLPSL